MSAVPLSTTRAWRITRDIGAVGIPIAVLLLAKRAFDGAFFLALLGCLSLPWRNRYPRVVLVLCLPGLAAGLGWAAMIVATFSLGRLEQRWRLLTAWGLLITVVALAPVVFFQSLRFVDYVLTTVFVLFMVVIPIALGVLVTTRQQLYESLTRLQEATEAELAAKAETARAEERARIAREIHDAVGHHVTLIAVESAALATTTNDPAAAEAATRVRGLAKEAMREMRTTLGLGTDHPAQSAGLGTIPELIERARATGLDVSLTNELANAQGEVPPGVGRAAYRVVQEALTNASKHSPGSDVSVELRATDGALRVAVRNGAPERRAQAIDVGRGGSGLEGLAERVETVGGRLEVGPSDGGGFRLVAILPQESPSA